VTYLPDAASVVAVIDEPPEAALISDSGRVAATLEAAPEFADWQHQELAQLAQYVWERRIPAGGLLCRRGEPAVNAFCLVEGSVRHGEGGRTTSTGFVGHEAALDAPTYLADITAATDVFVLVVPRTVLSHFGITLNGETLYHSLLRHYATPLAQPDAAADAATSAGEGAEEDAARPTLTKSIGWGLTLILPALILIFGGRYGLNWHQRDFLAALGVCLLMMSFNLTAQYAAALIAGLACLLLDVAPANVILSGFASDGFFMGLSIFGLGAVLTSSGLAERLVLNILRLSPQSPFWYNATVLLTGVVMTPCLPSANTRVALMTPLIMETSRALGYRDKSREATRLMLSMFVGASLFAPIFLTAKSLNFVIYTQLPDQIRDQFQWLKWTLSASLAGFVMLALYLVASGVMFRKGDKPQLSRPHLETQLRVLGPMRPGEWTALTIAITFIVAIVTYSLHKISPAWITLGVFCVFLVLGTLDERHIRHNFQWDVLLLVGFFIGLEQTLDFTGITAILTGRLSGVTEYMGSNFILLIGLMAVITFLLRLFLPITTAGVLVASVFLPLAALNGINPWVVGFAIMMLSETWFLPAQCSYFLTLEELSGERPVHDRALFLRMNAVSMAIRLVALLASIPFFRYMDLL
jgi:DASS family divalent anion:Na+ symporter